MNRLPNASRSAGGRTSTPSLRKLQAPTSSPSRLRAVSHRMVASEPVTERFGPRSTPTRIALVTRSGVGDLRGAPGDETCGQIVHQVAGKGVEDPGSPGRLGSDCSAAERSTSPSARMRPVLPSASTSTNRPATSGSAPQEMPSSMRSRLFPISPMARAGIAGRAFRRDKTEEGHQLSRRIEPAHVADLGGKSHSDDKRGAAH
jgi:hypothetical protein